jgi:hypothetical protein
MIASGVFVLFVLVELYYWFVYVPRAWRNPGTNREIDDIRFVWERVDCAGNPKRPEGWRSGVSDNRTDEEWYDQEVAPTLLKLVRACKDRGISMLAFVEWNSGKIGSTMYCTPKACPEMTMLALCAKAGTNVDLYMLSLIAFCEKSGINMDESIFMRIGKST